MNKCCVRKVWSFPFPHLFILLTDCFERFNFVSFILQDSCAGDQKRLTVVLAYLSLHSKSTYNQVDYHETLTLHRNYHALFIFVSSSFFNHITLDTMIIEQRNFWLAVHPFIQTVIFIDVAFCLADAKWPDRCLLLFQG